MHAVDQRGGADLLSDTKVITQSGRQTQIKTVNIITYVADLSQSQTAGGTGAGGVNGATVTGGQGAVGSQVQPLTSSLEVGPTLDVIPYVSADGYTVQMTIIPTIKEFLGYDDPGPFVAQIQGAAGNTAPVLATPTPLPKFRLRQVVTSVSVWDGQTVVLGGLISEDVQKVKDKVPFLGDLPLLGRFFRSESSTTKKRNLVIFVTPTITDPAGNPVHSQEEMPFALTSIPAQKPAEK